MSNKIAFVLGAGFSKAVSKKMPLLWELNNVILKLLKDQTHQEQHGEYLDTIEKALHFSDNIEHLLSFLSQDFPWLTKNERNYRQALFGTIKNEITNFIRASENNIDFSRELPHWTKGLISFLHQMKCPVISFNYDTVVEKIIKESQDVNPDISRLYQFPIADLAERTSGGFIADNGINQETFDFIKIHGSTNWYYNENDDFKFQNIYYDNVLTKKAKGYHSFLSQVNSQDLSPLILPPVSDKSSLYALTIVKTLWHKFRKSLAQAETIFFCGYSLPLSDHIMEIFLKGEVNKKEKKVFLVDSSDSTELVKRYAAIFGSKNLNTEFTGTNDAIEKMTDHLIKNYRP